MNFIKRRTLLRAGIIVVIVILVVASGNARALSQLTIYIPIVVDGTVESPSPTTPPPSTTEPPTTEPPTTEPPTTEPPTTEPPTTEPQTTEPPPTTVPPPDPTGNIVIRDIFYDGIVSSQEPYEYVEIRNDDNVPLQMNNWILSDVQNHVFTFPSFVIQPNQTCRVYTNQVHPQWSGFSYGSGSAIWNNGSDTATLKDGNGTLVDEYSY